jgi:hypothetical protein
MNRRPPKIETPFEEIPLAPRERHEFFVDLFGRYLFWAMQEAMFKSRELVSSPESRARLGRAFERPYREVAELNHGQREVAFEFARATMENAVKNILIILAAEGITFRLGDRHAVQFRLTGEIRDVEEMETQLEEVLNRGGDKAFTSNWGRWLRQNSSGFKPSA